MVKRIVIIVMAIFISIGCIGCNLYIADTTKEGIVIGGKIYYPNQNGWYPIERGEKIGCLNNLFTTVYYIKNDKNHIGIVIDDVFADADYAPYFEENENLNFPEAENIVGMMWKDAKEINYEIIDKNEVTNKICELYRSIESMTIDGDYYTDEFICVFDKIKPGYYYEISVYSQGNQYWIVNKNGDPVKLPNDIVEILTKH
ncbi:MAG: hypothetical protein RR588_09590 [Solibacillus sp.]